MNKLNKIFFFVFCLCYLLCAFSTVVYAADYSLINVDTNYVPLTTIPGVFNQSQGIINPVNVLKGIYGLAIGVGSVIAVVMIIFAGFKYMYQESMSGKSGAKEMIQNAIYGLLLILASYIILRTINPALVEFDINLPGGSGKLRGLVAAQARSEALYAESIKGSAERGAILTDIENLKKAISFPPEIQKELDDLVEEFESKKADPGVTLTEEERSEFERKIADLRRRGNEDVIAALSAENPPTTIENIQKEIVAKSISIDTILTERTSGINRQANFASETARLAAIIKEGGDPVTAVKNTLDAFSVQTSFNSIASIQKSIETARALPVTDANRAEVNAYIAKAQQNIAYLEGSKIMIDEVKSLPQTNRTMIGIPTPGGGVRYEDKPKPIAERSAQFDAVISKYNQQIAAYTTQGRSDLATNLRNDIASLTTVMKIGTESQCGGTANASLTLCKP